MVGRWDPQHDKAAVMPGQMRKIMAYLGLVDDEYDDYDDLNDRRSAPSRPSRPQPRDRYEDDDRYDRYDRPEPRGARTERGDRYDREPQASTQFGTVSRIHPMTRDGRPVDDRAPRQTAQRVAVTPMAPVAKLPVVEPRSFGDAKQVGDHIKQSSTVILNLQGADAQLQRRMMDFSSGMAYVLGCRMRRVVDGVFVITPANVTLSDEELARLQERDFSDH